ncbi:hypothetical protein ACWEFL_34520 [Streptomyces sp. NPDC004838]
MRSSWKRPAVCAALTAFLATALAAGAAGCSNGGGGTSGVASKAASAVSSVGAQATAAIASATAAAGRKLNEIKNGVDAKGEVKLGAAATTSEGYATTEFTVHNTADSPKSFAVQVNFKDSGGKLLDTVVVTVSDVPASQSKTATARSNRKLSGEVKPEVGTALRY